MPVHCRMLGLVATGRRCSTPTGFTAFPTTTRRCGPTATACWPAPALPAPSTRPARSGCCSRWGRRIGIEIDRAVDACCAMRNALPSHHDQVVPAQGLEALFRKRKRFRRPTCTHEAIANAASGFGYGASGGRHGRSRVPPSCVERHRAGAMVGLGQRQLANDLCVPGR